MNVRELITDLLERDLDAEVELYIISDEEDDDFEFQLEEYRSHNGSRLSIDVNLDKYVMVDKRDYEDMKRKIEDLEEELADANRQLEELQDE